MSSTSVHVEPEGLRERAGRWIGRAWAPFIATIARLRHARMFHPEGHTFTGVVEPASEHDDRAPSEPSLTRLAEVLGGRVLARFSGALWRGQVEHFDVLGLALRFRPSAHPFDHRPLAGDTDLLTATIRSPLTMLGAPLVTDASDFVGNRYWAVSPFELDGVRFELRLVPVSGGPSGGTRLERLRAAVATGRAAWWLDARRTLHLRWHRVARVQLDAPVELDQDALRFDPFRGVLRPVGLVHAIRRAAYPASQDSRPPRGPG